MRVEMIAVFASLYAFVNNVHCSSNYDMLYKDISKTNEQSSCNNDERLLDSDTSELQNTTSETNKEKNKHIQCPKHKYYKNNAMKHTRNRRNEGRVLTTHDQ